MQRQIKCKKTKKASAKEKEKRFWRDGNYSGCEWRAFRATNLAVLCLRFDKSPSLPLFAYNSYAHDLHSFAFMTVGMSGGRGGISKRGSKSNVKYGKYVILFCL